MRYGVLPCAMCQSCPTPCPGWQLLLQPCLTSCASGDRINATPVQNHFCTETCLKSVKLHQSGLHRRAQDTVSLWYNSYILLCYSCKNKNVYTPKSSGKTYFTPQQMKMSLNHCDKRFGKFAIPAFKPKRFRIYINEHFTWAVASWFASSVRRGTFRNFRLPPVFFGGGGPEYTTVHVQNEGVGPSGGAKGWIWTEQKLLVPTLNYQTFSALSERMYHHYKNKLSNGRCF